MLYTLFMAHLFYGDNYNPFYSNDSWYSLSITSKLSKRPDINLWKSRQIIPEQTQPDKDNTSSFIIE